MKLHLPLALRAALLMTMAAFISPASMAEVVVSQNIDYVYNADIYHRGAISYVGDGSEPTYTLSFTATRNEQDVVNSRAFALFGGEMSISNIRTLAFTANCGQGADYNPDALTTTEKIGLSSGGAICAGMSADVKQEENSPYASKVSLINNGEVIFLNNSARDNGGAIALKNSDFISEGNERVVFSENIANGGGAIIAHNSDVIFKRNGEIVFSGNETTVNNGGAIKIGGSAYTETSNLLFNGNNRIEFSSNSSYMYGAAIYFGSTTSGCAVFQNNINSDGSEASISFVGNQSAYSGSAIYAAESLQFLNNGNIEFISNSTTDALSSSGGAIYALDSVVFDGNAGILFQGNGSEDAGGAAHVSGAFTLCNTTGVVNFYDNEAASDGGALNLTESAVKNISGNKQVVFELNVAGGDGGAMDAEGELVISDNEELKFINNRSGRNGGALHKAYDYSNQGLSISGGNLMLAEGNAANESGGAIYFSGADGGMAISGIDTVKFLNNTAGVRGGAVYVDADGGDRTALGIVGNGSVLFSGNSAESGGGAIYAGGAISICGNAGDVVFRDNYLRRYDSNGVLQSIVLNSVARDNSRTAYFAAEAGQSIIFADATTQLANEHNHTYLNQYTPEGSTEAVTTQGTILFTGADARTRLAKLWTENGLTPQGDAFEAALEESVTSTLNTTTLYGGTLAVEDGAVVNMWTFSAKKGATLRLANDAKVVLTAYMGGSSAPMFESGSTLYVEHDAVIDTSNTNTVSMGNGSSLRLRDAELTVQGKMRFGASADEYAVVYLSGYGVGKHTLVHATGGLALNGALYVEADSNHAVTDERMYYLVTADNDSLDATVGKVGSTTLYWTAERGFWDLSEWESNGVNLNVDKPAGSALVVDSNHFYNGDKVVFNQGGEVYLDVEVTPSEVLIGGDKQLMLLGNGGIVGNTQLVKSGKGDAVISTANSYTGGTVLKEGTIYAFNDDALGTGAISCSGNVGISVGSDNKLNLYSSIQNSGALVLYGAFDVSSLEATQHSMSVDAEGKLGANGFATQGGYMVQMVRGGTLTNLATVYYGADQLTLGDDGTAVFRGTVDYTRYTVADGNNTSLAAIRQAATRHGAAKTSVTTIGGALLMNDAVSGNLTLSGGTVVMENSTVAVSGSLVLGDAVQLSLQGKYVAGVEYTLISAGSISGDVQRWTVTGTHPRQAYTLYLSGNSLMMDVEAFAATLTWANAKKAVWQDGAGGWEQGESFYAGDSVIFTEGTVSIVGEVQPGEIDVAVAKSLSFKTTFNKKTGEYSGAIVGDDTSLTIAATTTKGKVTMNDGNRYGGGTTILSGTVRAGGAMSFGTGDIYMYGGTLDLASKEVANIIFLEGAGVIKGGKKFLGSLAMAADLLKGSQLNIVEGQSATIFSGTVNGTISGAGEVLVTYRPETGYPAPQLGTTGKITTNSLRLMEDSVLLVSNKGLAMNSKASAITIEGGMLSSAGKISAYSLSMTGGTLDVTNAKPMGITLKDAFVATDGADIDLYGALTANQLTLEGVDFTLAMDEADVTTKLKPKAQTISIKGKNLLNTINGSTLDVAGKMSVTGDSALLDSTISLHDVAGAAKPKAQGLTVKGVMIADGTELVTTGAVSAAALTASESVIAIAAEEGLAAQSLKLTRKDATKGVPQENILSDCAVYVNGSMSVAGNLQLLNSDIYLRDYSGKNKAQGLSVKGALAVDDSSLSTTGTVSAAALTATDSSISIAAQEGLAAQSLKLTRKEVIKGTPQDNILTNCDVYVNGSMSVAGNLQLLNSDIYLRDYSGKNKAQGLSVKGDLTVGSGSVLSLTGALSAKNLTLEGGCSLTLGSAKFSTVKVGGALTLKGEVNFALGFTVTEKDVAKGKEYTLFSFKSLVGDVSNLTLGYKGEYTLALNTKETAIVLTVKDAATWNAYVADVQEALKKDEPKTEVEADESSVSEETVDAEELLLKPVAAAADVDPLLAKVADTLVQSTWGTVGASRAFGETIASRGRHASLLDDGRGAAWLSVMGGSSRISSADGYNGADFTLSGAAFGVEGRVGEKNTLGVAVGNSWGKVSTFSAFPVDQDSMHVGIYGNHKLSKSLTLSWMATHTRTESDATILGAPYSWSQDALQLDARLTWGKSLSEKTAVSAFAGLQYLATDSGECAGLKTGSLQNLRAELGVGARRMCSDNTMVFGELSFIGDMVRNNPTAAIGDYRTHGTNPGRVGLNLSVGAQHQLSEDWSLNASYSLELMENSTSHSLNVGASYSF